MSKHIRDVVFSHYFPFEFGWLWAYGIHWYGRVTVLLSPILWGKSEEVEAYRVEGTCSRLYKVGERTSTNWFSSHSQHSQHNHQSSVKAILLKILIISILSSW